MQVWLSSPTMNTNNEIENGFMNYEGDRKLDKDTGYLHETSLFFLNRKLKYLEGSKPGKAMQADWQGKFFLQSLQCLGLKPLERQ